MEEIVLALAQSVAHAGPEWAFAIAAIVAIAYKGIPIVEEVTRSHIELEHAREERKAGESRRRDEFERERSKLEGRWLEQYEHATHVQEQTNAVMDGVEAQMATLNATLAESKDRSRDMSHKVDELLSAVGRRPTETEG